MSENTLMTDAATTTEGAPTSTGADTATTTATQAAATDASTAQQQQATDGTQAAPSTNTEEATKSDGTEEKPAEKLGAPEKYEFKAPENIVVDEATLGAFSEIAKELDMPQEAAQKILDKMGPAMAAKSSEAIANLHKSWGEQTKTDKEFGGEKLNENLAVAKKALDAFGTPELRTLLNQSGLGNHPEIIRAFFKAGKSISEDRMVSSGTGGQSGSRDLSKALYPNQQT